VGGRRLVSSGLEYGEFAGFCEHGHDMSSSARNFF
jgi:hypothetical protein